MRHAWCRCAAMLLLVLSSALPAAAQDDKAVAFAAWVGLARAEADAGNRAAAVAAWREAERLAPLDLELQRELFWSLAAVDPADARRVARGLLAAAPDDDAVRERAIALAREADDAGEADRLAEEGLQVRPSARWWRALGVTALVRGDHAAAVERLRSAVASGDHTEGDRALLAVALGAAGLAAGAVEMWDTVPADVWRANAQWTRSRLHARLTAAADEQARADGEAWMRAHADDHETRRLLVTALQRAGQHEAALDLAGGAPDEVDWLRLRALVADQAGRGELAHELRRQLAMRPDATRPDRVNAADWLRRHGHEGEALTVARGLVRRGERCADEAVALLFRMQSPAALDELTEVMRSYPTTCGGFQSSMRGVIDRLMAAERFAEAAELAEPLAVLSRDPADRETAGRLRLWNGDAAGAAAVLWPLVVRGAASAEGEDAAIDALRLEGRLGEAWMLAARRIDDPTLDPARVLSLAELAVDAGVYDVARAAATRIARVDAARKPHARRVIAETLLRSGDASAALDLLERIPLDARGLRTREEARAVVAAAWLDRSAPAQAIDVLTRGQEPLPVRHRVLLARAYAATNRLHEALDAMTEADALGIDDAIYRATLVARVATTAAAGREYERLAARADAIADVYLAWSGVSQDAASRARILRLARRRFPGNAPLAAALATAHAAAGDAAAAAKVAREAIALDERQADAWRVLVDLARRSRANADVAALTRAPIVFADEAPLVIELAERLGAAGASDAASDAALAWLRGVDAATPALHVAREIAVARILNSRGQLQEALEIITPLAARADAPADVLRLHAQVLGWSGRHEVSLDAYERYLALRPDDREARREQARVAGWAQQFERARRLYAEIDARYPGDSAAHAEADAKRLFFASRWSDAARAYQRWLEVEPQSEEAAFEYAETLVAQGRLPEARRVYDSLTRRPRPHEMAHRARRMLDERADPSGLVTATYSSASGYGGRRLLDVSDVSGRLSVPLFHNTRHAFDLSAGSLVFADGAQRLPAYRAGASAMTGGRRVSLQASAAVVNGSHDAAYWQGRAESSFLLRHDVDLRLALTRAPLLENIATVRAGATTWGPSVTLALARPDTELSASAGASWLQDNLQRSAAVSLRQRVRRGASELRVLSSATYAGWQREDPRFFSPERFVKAEAGAEWTHWLRAPRFRVDRRSSMTLRYLAGLDSQGELYHQPSGQLSIEHRRLAFDAELSWITSRVYRSLGLRLGVRIGG